MPSSVPAGEPGPNATVTVPVNPVTVLPNTSRTATRTAGATGTPAVPSDGGTTKLSWVGLPGAIVNGADVAPLRPLAVAINV